MNDPKSSQVISHLMLLGLILTDIVFLLTHRAFGYGFVEIQCIFLPRLPLEKELVYKDQLLGLDA